MECHVSKSAYSNTSQLDLRGRRDLGGSQGHKLLSELVEGGNEVLLVLVSKLVSFHFLLGLHWSVY